MNALLIFSITLFLGVLLSALAHRTVASTSVLFLLSGFLAGSGVFGWIEVEPQSPVLSGLAEVALFAILFTDGMEIGIHRLKEDWQLPARALGFGLPLTLLGIALIAHFLAGLDWPRALLVGAVLSPTDPVFAAAIVERIEVPARIRHLLNVESGLNDGLALPLVVVLLAVVSKTPVHVGQLIFELGWGVVLGVSVAWIASKLERLTDLFSASEKYAPFFALSIGLLTFGLAKIAHANEYLASYFAGATIATVHPKLRVDFKSFGERIAELLKLAALLAFGALISHKFMLQLPVGDYVSAFLILIVVRPLALQISFFGTSLNARERITAYWFGPKGFASVVYGIMILNSGLDPTDRCFKLIAIVVAASILAHSSTDVVVANWVSPKKEG